MPRPNTTANEAICRMKRTHTQVLAQLGTAVPPGSDHRLAAATNATNVKPSASGHSTPVVRTIVRKVDRERKRRSIEASIKKTKRASAKPIRTPVTCHACPNQSGISFPRQANSGTIVRTPARLPGRTSGGSARMRAVRTNHQ